MEGMKASDIVEKMLETEKNACQVLQGALEKANEIVLQAKVERNKLIQKTKKNIQKEQESLKKRLLAEGEQEVGRIIAEQEKYLKQLRKADVLQREPVLKKLREILFGDF